MKLFYVIFEKINSSIVRSIIYIYKFEIGIVLSLNRVYESLVFLSVCQISSRGNNTEWNFVKKRPNFVLIIIIVVLSLLVFLVIGIFMESKSKISLLSGSKIDISLIFFPWISCDHLIKYFLYFVISFDISLFLLKIEHVWETIIMSLPFLFI